jgi:predicted nucleic acid-binding protein
LKEFKIYLDTSVISAYFDDLKPLRQAITQKWFTHNAPDFDLFVSTLVLEEIGNNTDENLKRDMLNLLNSKSIPALEINDQILRLAEFYRQKILAKQVADTIHIATASHYSTDAIASWNFKHIVNIKTMKTIRDMNIEFGFKPLQILTLENLGGDQYGTL